MPRYRLTIAYDGTEFCGWQKQEPPEAPAAAGEGAGVTAAYGERTPLMGSEREGRVALRTVQGVVEQAVRGVCRERVELVGASRTDSGVHARGQVAAFSTLPDGKGTGWPSERGADRLMAAVNSRLPDDVTVLAASEVAVGFDPIGDAVKKMYSYTFSVGPVKPVWTRRVVNWLPRGELDVAAMNRAAELLVGEHDFAAFAAAGHGRLTTVRTVYSLSVSDAGSGDGGNRVVRMEVEGNGFLWNMVRIIAGTLMQVGLGQKSVEQVREALESRDRAKAGLTAPPQGLCLERIWYPE
ncbi:MAG TPA: tRNA pseudouridine synthase A [Phycisphaerales bacterium]|nr:tRNA pseudouridine synthase A [Phycisphaerales bacterium]